MPDISKRLKRYSKVEISNINLGGLADSDYLGGKNSVADMVGLDIHSEVGVIKVNQGLVKDSGSTVDDLCLALVPSSDGNTYAFGSTAGKIWQRTSAGVYSKVVDIGLGGNFCSAIEYQGYIYYCYGGILGTNYIGQWQLGTAWSTRNDTWATFTNRSSDHPMFILNDVLYIGDGNLIAQIDGVTFSANALDLPSGVTARCLTQLGTDLLVGTTTTTTDGFGNLLPSNQGAQIFRWNTWSVSFTNSDPITESSIEAFLALPNTILCITNRGTIYLYNGTTLNLYKTLRGNWSFDNQIRVNQQAVLNYNHLSLFGVSQGSLGVDPCNEGLYSLGRANANYPYVLNCELGIGDAFASAVMSNIEVGAMAYPNIGAGGGYLVSYRASASNQVGIAILSPSHKYPFAYLVPRQVTIDRMDLNTYGRINVAWRKKPASTGFTFYNKVNSGSFAQINDTMSDTDRNIDQTTIDMGDATTIQPKIAFTVSSNNAPEVEAIEIGLTTVD